MHILIVEKGTNKREQKQSSAVPPIGARVGCFGIGPTLTVVDQLWYPTYGDIAPYNLVHNHVDVIVFVAYVD